MFCELTTILQKAKTNKKRNKNSQSNTPYKN